MTSTASGYDRTWWEDVLGIEVDQDRRTTRGPATGRAPGSGPTSGEWPWASGTGWQIVPYGGSEDESWSCDRGTTHSTFENVSFCWPLPTVCTYDHHVRADGYPSGSICGARSTDSVDECAPLWMHWQIRKVT